MAQKIIEARIRQHAQRMVAEGVETPFLLIDMDEVERRAEALEHAAGSVFESVEIAYSYKSNNLTRVARLLAGRAWSAEVVSGDEMDAALADGFLASKVLFDGPLKRSDELAKALTRHIRVQIDSISEATELVRLAQGSAIRPVVSVRLCHPYKGRDSRFGFTEEELNSLFNSKLSSGLDIKGVHLHSGSNCESPQQTMEVISKYSSIINRILAQPGAWIDLGGGYPADSFSRERDAVSIYSYLKTLSGHLYDTLVAGVSPKVVLEPGRFLVEDAGYMVSTVHVTKKRNGTTFFVCDTGLHQIPSIRAWDHRVEELRYHEVSALTQQVAIAGANCFESDILFQAVGLSQSLSVGDQLIIRGCGGYDVPNTTMWTRRGAAIYACKGGEREIIRGRPLKSEFRKHDITDAQYPSQVQVSDEIQLEVLSRLYAQPLFDLTVKNAAYLSKWLAWPRSVVELGDSLNFIENAEKGFFLRESANYAVFYRGALCGVVGFNEVDKCNQAATIGYWIGKEYQGLGVARAAVARLIEVYRREYAIKRFVIKCAIFNERSNRLALALGFEHEGVLRRAELLNGVAQDQNVYGLIEGE